MANLDKNIFNQIFELTTDKKLLVKVPYLRVYLPEDFFEHKISEVIGADVETFGIFYFDVYGRDSKLFDEEDPYKKPERFLLTLPSIIRMIPTSIESSRDENKKLVKVLEFVQDDVFMVSVNLIRTWKNVSKIFDLFLKSFLPKEIPYNEVEMLINDCCAMNKTNLLIADTILEIMIAELYRDPNNLSRAFRFAIADNPKISMYSAKAVKMDALGRMNNTFAAISSGDPKQGITMSINRTRYNEPQKTSSIEESLTDI